ncbi:unnamed protein product [Spirodela intermedia]|uniref:Uncharacterized protein n=1 Tax=Spirodela intermedia TaxID=51605 RepID=A0A7I8LF33_SPIIN|nr:unnamed protein product [Spirodela intermedia]
METKVKIDHYRPINNLDTQERNYVIKDRLYKFLMGLNLEYETNIEEAIALTRQEENTINLRNNLKIENVAFNTLKGKDTYVLKKGDSEVPFIKGDPKTDPKAHLFYTYCRKNRHTRKTCWKVHGKPPNYGKLHLANAQNEDGVEPMIYGGVSQDGSTSSEPLEIEKLREEIE